MESILNAELCVDVIIPTYKRADMLTKAIDTVLNQSYRNVMITVVDDNNPDTEWRKDTSSLMRQYGSNGKVQYICHPYNKNGSAARNTGLKHTKGQFVCFLDDDDYFLEDKIKLQVEYLLKYQNMGACYCDCIINGKEMHLDNQQDFSHDILLGLPTPQTSGIMFRREVIDELDGFDESYYRHQDYELLLRFYDKYKMGKVDKILYVRERSSISNIPDGKTLEQIKKKMLTQFQYKINMISENDKNYYHEVKVYNYIHVLKCYIKQKCLWNATRVLFLSLSNGIFLTFKVLYKNFVWLKSNRNNC